jgi:hypothetical protein
MYETTRFIGKIQDITGLYLTGLPVTTNPITQFHAELRRFFCLLDASVPT